MTELRGRWPIWDTRKHSSPGRAWKSLQPWRPGTAGTTRKLEIWAKETASDRLSIPERSLKEVIALLWRADPGAQIPGKDISGNGFASHSLRSSATVIP